MAKVKISVEVEYDRRMQGSFDYAAGRIEKKINKVLGEFSKEVFNGAFAVSPMQIKEIKEKEKKNAKTTK